MSELLFQLCMYVQYVHSLVEGVYYVCQNDAVCVASSPDLVPAVPLVPGAGEVVEADRLIRCVRAWCYVRYLTQVTYVFMRNCQVDFPQNTARYNADFQ